MNLNATDIFVENGNLFVKLRNVWTEIIQLLASLKHKEITLSLCSKIQKKQPTGTAKDNDLLVLLFHA